MSSRFVSGGTIAGDSTQAAPAPTASQSPPAASSAQSSAWEKAQAQLAADRQAREAARKAAVESGSGQSLYDVLQANKAAKQAAFEEANKIRNQFRALDDDEVDFLDEITAKERREAEEQRHAEEIGLREFRNAQKKGSVSEDKGDAVEVDETLLDEWSTGGAKKRKREKEPVIKGIKRRVSENAKEAADANGNGKKEVSPAGTAQSSAAAKEKSAAKEKEAPGKPESAPSATAATSKMGLVDYGSDEDDDD